MLGVGEWGWGGCWEWVSGGSGGGEGGSNSTTCTNIVVYAALVGAVVDPCFSDRQNVSKPAQLGHCRCCGS